MGQASSLSHNRPDGPDMRRPAASFPTQRAQNIFSFANKMHHYIIYIYRVGIVVFVVYEVKTTVEDTRGAKRHILSATRETGKQDRVEMAEAS